ncbi:hypothetical protein F5I97DRAFT_1977021 [Phlebopus sp. FC_14]|nr:hypothetical protein F5I97DRAFT_1977021 [Phlebopus sp. FC_14]
MALDLLTDEALRGEIQHLYEHDAESFIWVLTWISLRYSNGQPIENKALDQWLIVDAVTCRKKKSDFLDLSGGLLNNKNYPPSEGHKFHLGIVYMYLRLIYGARGAHSFNQGSLGVYQDTGSVKSTESKDPKTVFKKSFIDPIHK